MQRFICSSLEDMRKCCKTQNYSYLPGLVDEAMAYSFNMLKTFLEEDKSDAWGCLICRPNNLKEAEKLLKSFKKEKGEWNDKKPTEEA